MAEVWTPPAFDDVATDEFVTAAQLNAFGNSLRFLKLVDEATFTSPVTISATTSSASNLIVASDTLTYENVPHIIEFGCPNVERAVASVAGSRCFIGVYDNGAANGVGRIWQCRGPASNNIEFPCYARFPITPSAASHTYQIRGYAPDDDYAANAGAGGNDVFAPGYIRIFRVPT